MFLYLEHLNKDSEVNDDELNVARAVMRELYEHAGRNRPGFFCDKPL